jgi:exosortase/archaeosortase family protein
VDAVATAPGGLSDLEAPMSATVEAGALVGGRLAHGTTGDDTGRSGVPAAARRAVWWRLALLALAIALVYGRDLASLSSALTVDGPLAYAALAPLIALVLAVLGTRDTPKASEVLPVRSGDAVCGGVLLVVAVVVGWRGPDLFGFASVPWRVSMASLPFFLAGSVWLLFGGRATWWLRHAFLFAALAAPVWYVWAVTPLLTLTTNLTWLLVAPLANVVGARTVDVGGTGLVAIGDQLAAVSAVCSGASSMVAWMIVGGALSTRLTGVGRRRWRWLLAGAVLAWVINIGRILTVVLVGRYVSATIALQWIHPVAGLVAITIVCAVMLGGARRLGLRPIDGEGAPVLNRLAAVVPPDWKAAGTAVVGSALVLALVAGTGGWRFDPMGGRNGAVNTPVSSRLSGSRALTVDGRAWSLVGFGDVPWASQYFGRGAAWHRYSVFEPTDGEQGSWSVAVDTTEVGDAPNLDTYTLEACYGFHGYQLERSEVTDLLPGRPAERIDYLDEGTRLRTVVVSWRQQVADGRIERVVVSAQARTTQVTATTAQLPDLGSAERAAVLVARTLSASA